VRNKTVPGTRKRVFCRVRKRGGAVGPLRKKINYLGGHAKKGADSSPIREEKEKGLREKRGKGRVPQFFPGAGTHQGARRTSREGIHGINLQGGGPLA